MISGSVHVSAPDGKDSRDQIALAGQIVLTAGAHAVRPWGGTLVEADSDDGFGARPASVSVIRI